MAVRDTILTLSVYYKRRVWYKVEYHTKPITALANVKERPIISCQKGKNPRERKIFKVNTRFHAVIDRQLVTPCSFSTKNNLRIQKARVGVFLCVQLTSLAYFLRCPVINRETKLSFTIKGLGDFNHTIILADK